jgi:hypothetical protein
VSKSNQSPKVPTNKLSKRRRYVLLIDFKKSIVVPELPFLDIKYSYCLGYFLTYACNEFECNIRKIVQSDGEDFY